MGNKQLAIGGGVAVLLAVGGWLGAGVYGGQRIEAELKALQAAPSGPGGSLRVTALQHERGLLSSRGKIDLQLEPGCDAAEDDDEPLTVHLDYQVSHLPLPTSLARFEWQAQPTGDTGETFRQVFGSATRLSGRGAVTVGGALRTEMSLPELSVRRAGSALQVAPSSGFVSFKDKQVGFGWTWPRIVARGDGQAVEMKDAAVDLDLKNRFLGTGTMQLRVASLSTGFGSAEGLSLKSEAAEDGDRLNMSVTPSVAKLVAGGQTAESLALELSIKGMDTRSVETLSTIISDSCGLQALTADEGQKLREAVVTLLTRGFSAGIAQLRGKSAEGSIDGQWTVELQPAKDGQIHLATQLRSSGRLDLLGKVITDKQRQMALGRGLAVEQDKGLRASYEYADGLLKVNGRTMDAGGFQEALVLADARIAEQLAQWDPGRGVRRAVAAAPAPKTAEPVATPEPAPAAAPAAPATPEPAPAAAPAPTAAAPAPTAPSNAKACETLEACAQQTLVAGRAQDIDAVRAIASRIDALPKPDIGNKAVARQLNTTALEALKRDDTAAAVTALRQAVHENPRDVEIVANLGFALVKANRAAEAFDVLLAALVLDPRRTSTWTPLAEALAMLGHAADAQAALWVAYQWSANREKSLAFYQDRAANETHAPLQALYARMATEAGNP